MNFTAQHSDFLENYFYRVPLCTFILRASKQTQETLITLQFIVTGNVTQFIASFHK